MVPPTHSLNNQRSHFKLLPVSFDTTATVAKGRHEDRQREVDGDHIRVLRQATFAQPAFEMLKRVEIRQFMPQLAQGWVEENPENGC